MARVPLNAYGQSRYTDQLLQTVLIPTVVTNSVNGDDFYTIETDISTSTLHADTVYAGTVNTSIIGLGDLATKTLALGSQSLQGDYTSRTDTTVIGVRAAGNDNFRGTFDGNVLIGAETGLNLCNTNYSTYIGANSGTFGQATSNVVVGYGACVGISGTPTVGNVILGAGAGLSNTGNSNVFIGLNAGANVTVSNTLIVHNTSSSVNPLLYGRFDSRQLGVNCVPTRNFQVSGSTLLNGDLTVSGNIAIAGSLSGLTTLGINCVPTVTFQVSGSTILKNLSASNVLTRTLGVNYVPTIDTVSLGTTFGVSGRTFFNGDVTVLGTITGAVAPTGISGFAADLHGGGHGYYGGVSLSDSKITLSGTITTLSSTTNYIGGVYLLNSNVSLGGNISNVSSSTNFIGGVYLRNSNISFDGTISNNTAYANRIGDVYLVNGDISFGLTTGKITTFSNTSNRIGGVYLGSNNISLTGTISNISSNTSYIGGVYLGCNNISTAGTVGGVYLSGSNISTAGTIRNISTTTNFIGGVYLENCNISFGGGLRMPGIAMGNGGYISISQSLDAGGTICNACNSVNFIGGVYLSNNAVETSCNYRSSVAGVAFMSNWISAGGLSNNISQGYFGGVNMSFGNIIGAGGYNRIGAVTLSGSNVTLSGYISNLCNTSNYIGGVTLSGGAISTLNIASNSIGGVRLQNYSICLEGYGTISTDPTSTSFIGGVYLGNSNISLGGTVGGVYLQNSNISLIGTGKIATPSNTSNSVGGVTLSNGLISTPESSSNYIGGVYLRSSNISLIGTGKILTPSNNTSVIGGVYLGFNDICLSGKVGGVSISSNAIRTESNTLNYIGGVYLSNKTISLDGTIANQESSSNFIGGVYLSNRTISLTGRIANLSNTSNYIGGVTLSSGVITGDGIGLSNISGATVVGNVSGANVATYLKTTSQPAQLVGGATVSLSLPDGYYLFTGGYSQVVSVVNPTGIVWISGGVLNFTVYSTNCRVFQDVIGSIKVSNANSYTCLFAFMRLTF